MNKKRKQNVQKPGRVDEELFLVLCICPNWRSHPDLESTLFVVDDRQDGDFEPFQTPQKGQNPAEISLIFN